MADTDVVLRGPTGFDVILSEPVPEVYVNVSGTWKRAEGVFVNVSGTWKEAASLSVNVAGTWKAS